jgi:hypothetical protein
MRHYSIFAVALAALFAVPAAAQNTQSWVASTGSDANACTRAAPCATFNGAYAKTNAKGWIFCVDRGNYGPIETSRAVSIDCEPGGIVVPGVAGIAIRLNGGANDVVTLRGLELEGDYSNGSSGIQIVDAGKVFIDRVTIRNFGHAGISAQHGTQVFVTDTTITGNGGNGGASNGGLVFDVGPDFVYNIKAVLTRVTIAGNRGDGIVARTLSTLVGSSSVSVTVRDSTISGNVRGVAVLAGSSANAKMVLEGVQVSGNSGAGLFAQNARGTIVANDARITGNATGVSTASSGKVLSAGGNVLIGNGSDGAFTGTVAEQ